MKRILAYVLSIAVILSCLAGGAVSAEDVVVIAHPAVPAETITRYEAHDIFAGDIRLWKNGDRVIVFDLEPKTEAKEAFYRFIGRSTSRMKSIWMKNLLSGEGGPPQALESESAVLSRVRSTPGAIGYVRASLLDGTVKVLARVPREEE